MPIPEKVSHLHPQWALRTPGWHAPLDQRPPAASRTPGPVAPLRIAYVGCGSTATAYAETLQAYPQVKIAGATDLVSERAREFVADFGGRAYESLDDVLADPDVDAISNLTGHDMRWQVTARCLQQGKHVFSEAPLAPSYLEAKHLVDMSEQLGQRLCCAPITYMGEAQQTAWKVIREGQLGKVGVVYAEINWGQTGAGYPSLNPSPRVGVLFDVGVHPLTMLTAFLGPARRVTASAKVIFREENVANAGDRPDFIVAAVEMADGALVRLTTSSFVGPGSKQQGIEFHGDRGSLLLYSWHDFAAAVEVATPDSPYTPVPFVRDPYGGTEWGRALVEMADAIAEGRPHRATGAHAAHVIEILGAIETSFKKGRPVTVKSSFPPPAPMAWAR
jgi:predicted dehydrogenase